MHAHVVGCHCLAGCAHAYRVRSQAPGHSDFCWCLILRPRKLQIHTLPKGNVQPPGRLPNGLPEFFIVSVTHIAEPGSQGIAVGPNQRGGNKGRNVIPDQHKISRTIGGIDSSRRIGQKQRLRSHKLHQPYGQHHITDCVPLIVVHPALHADYRNLSYIAENKTALVSFHRRPGKALNILVIQNSLHTDSLRIIPKSRSQHQSYLRHKIDPLPAAFIAV